MGLADWIFLAFVLAMGMAVLPLLACNILSSDTSVDADPAALITMFAIAFLGLHLDGNDRRAFLAEGHHNLDFLSVSYAKNAALGSVWFEEDEAEIY